LLPQLLELLPTYLHLDAFVLAQLYGEPPNNAHPFEATLGEAPLGSKVMREGEEVDPLQTLCLEDVLQEGDDGIAPIALAPIILLADDDA